MWTLRLPEVESDPYVKEDEEAQSQTAPFQSQPR